MYLLIMSNVYFSMPGKTTYDASFYFSDGEEKGEGEEELE